VSERGADDGAAPQISDRYTIVRQLGRGGMAAVYLARDTRYDRDVAIKVMHSEIASGVGADRFLREISVAAKLTHPHIVPLLDSGAVERTLWFAMPVIDGQSLRERMEREHQLPVAEAVRIAMDVAGALAYAHAHGVIHRDIKPENVLLSSGSAVVADFGLAKGLEAGGAESLTNTGIAVGTALYMSPEQATGADVVDGRTDIYSLGCVLYEMITGEPPYVGKTVQAVIAKRFSDPVPSARRLRTTISPLLDDVIACALAKAPADRFATADAFADALARALEAGVSTSNPSCAAASAATPALAPVRSTARALPVVAGVLTAVVLIAALALWRFGRQTDHVDPRRPRSIAVLPFANESDDKDQEYFSAGMTDELLSALSAIKQLRVAARASSYAVRNQATDVRQIGRTLNVESVLEGSVRKAGDHVRVSVELVSTTDGFRIWNATYDKNLSDVFAMQEQIAQAVVSSIKLQLSDQHAIVRQSTGDVEAYQMYLRGRHAVDQRTPAALRDAADWFRKATDRDPLYARAWSGLADVYILEGLNFYAPPKDAFPKGEAAARRALSLDSTLAEAHTSLGAVLYLYDRDFTKSRAEFDRAIALDPSYPAAHYFYSLMLTGRDPDRAKAEAERAQALDPLSPPVAQGVGMVLVGNARYADAVPTLRAATQLDPGYYFPHAWLGAALAHSGQAAEAVAEARRAVELNPGSTLVLAFLGEVYAVTGDRTSALHVVAQLDSISHVRPVCGTYVARVLDRLGDSNGAFRWLEYAVADREGQLSQMRYPDTFPHISKDPRYQALIRRLGLEN
jgi:serine/threonine-protein kinase